MNHSFLRLAWRLAVALSLLAGLQAQNLSPRAYVITPVDASAVILSYSYFDGGLNFNGTVPITGATGTYSVPVLAYYHSFNLLGRSANLTAALPYAVGTFQGSVLGTQTQVYRSGLLDSSFRLAVNLFGGPAMRPKEFVKWKQKTLLGASLNVIVPTGQYDPYKLINWGINRWAVKPEFGYSQRWGHWVLDGFAGVWFYTANNQAFAGPSPKTQTLEPIGSLEGHLSRDFGTKRRFWISFDGNFWFGGTSSLNGVQNLASRQTSSRIGGTFSYPLNRRQSIKLNYSDGAYIRFGGNYQSISVGWQYSWIGRL